jgi:MFS transporter, OPA family, glycerol-3-phosphate transporter
MGTAVKRSYREVESLIGINHTDSTAQFPREKGVPFVGRVEKVSVPNSTQASTESPEPKPHQGENTLLWTLWLTYGAFYFCRTNLSAAVSGIKQPVEAGGLGLSSEEVGWILASLKIAYGLGQLINGQMSERIRPRILLAIGMFGSAALNVLFGLSTGLYFLLFVWACNGYCQSLGWTPCMRAIGNWIPTSRRGRVIGLIGTGYQVTVGLTYVIASFSVERFGWRGAVFVPSVLLAICGVVMLFLLRESPEKSSDKESDGSAPAPADKGTLRENIYLTLFNPGLWLLGISLGLLNACRYGFFDWGLTHLIEVQESSIGKTGLKFFLIAPGAAAGAFLSGWVTDRYFNSRRAPVICGLLVLLAGLTLLYESVARSTEPWAGAVLCVLLVMIGFCIMGPQVLLVGTAPADLAHRGRTAAAAGFVNFMGYMGAATGDVVTGYFTDESMGAPVDGWQTAIWIWAGWAFAAAVFVSFLWNATTAERVGFLPALVPKLAGIAGLTAMTQSLYLHGEFVGVTLGLSVGILPMLFSHKFRRLAILSAVLSGVGVIYFFCTYARNMGAPVTWELATGLAGAGVALIASIMILTDER